ncbi:hypothetical protein TNCV_786721 [Trichonephila clavipes]|nr:hypothetical protein TNCV_786721 [Trichonephila clavipes]
MDKINNKKPSKKQVKKRRVSLSSLSEKIPVDTSGDSFDEDNDDGFCTVHTGYFFTKKSKVRLDLMQQMVARKLQ